MVEAGPPGPRSVIADGRWLSRNDYHAAIDVRAEHVLKMNEIGWRAFDAAVVDVLLRGSRDA